MTQQSDSERPDARRTRVPATAGKASQMADMGIADSVAIPDLDFWLKDQTQTGTFAPVPNQPLGFHGAPAIRASK